MPRRKNAKRLKVLVRSPSPPAVPSNTTDNGNQAYILGLILMEPHCALHQTVRAVDLFGKQFNLPKGNNSPYNPRICF
ncbi:hypothetical protein PoB_006242400 [Plakobranchus ocellatus]|uniref:Uncharacterized protein n=1 Tax=Plakobranchus ocellatus TaxID=259542 RepID=A0AAV4CVK5_9GAST|nr:hypothetical protein PoB_006242400 [Plakobranchus ocellatus]